MIKRKDHLLERLQMIRPYPQHAVVTHSDLLARNKMKPPVRQRFGNPAIIEWLTRAYL
jgi:hypothetical protein